MKETGARIDNVYDINFKSLISIIQDVFPTNPHSMVSISGRNLTFWLLVSMWDLSKIDTSACSLFHLNIIECISYDISTCNPFHINTYIIHL